MSESDVRYVRLATNMEVGNGEPYDEDLIFDAVELARDSGNPCAAYALARAKLCGVNGPPDREGAIRLYEEAKAGGCSCGTREGTFNGCLEPWPGPFFCKIKENTDHCGTLLTYMVRHMLGIRAEYDPEQALDYWGVFSARQLRRCEHREIADALAYQVICKIPFLKIFRDFIGGNISLLEDANDAEIDALARCAEGFEVETAITFIALRVIAANEGWRNYPTWRSVSIRLELAILKVSEADLAASHGAIGLAQNALSASGIIKPGEFLPGPDGVMWMTRLDGIQFFTDGNVITELRPIGAQEEGEAPLVTGDDFLVALCLAFGGEKAERPWLSLEAPPNHFTNGRISALQFKEMNPSWLAATEFGGSLYIADMMTGRFCSGRGIVSLTDPFHLEASDLANSVRGYFERYSVAHPVMGSDSTRICLTLFSVKTSTRRSQPRKRNGFFSPREVSNVVTFDELGFRIDGSGLDYGSAHRQATYENDPTKPEAHTGLALTNRLPKLEQAFPVFRRVKYLFALTRVLIELREKGLSLSPPMLAELDGIRKALVQRSKGVCLLVAPP